MNGREGVVNHRSADSLRFVYGICSSDKETRSLALNSISDILDRWLDGYGSPPGGSGTEFSCDSGVVCCANPRLFVKEQLPDLLRLSTDCPFADIRARCSEILADLQSRGIEIPRKRFTGVSSFIPCTEAVTVDEDDTVTYELLVMAFLQNNRLENLFQVMAYHPQYLECFLRTQQFLMRGDGPLPFSYRHYIAIMASSQHQCSYLINIHTSEYLLQGGDERWLRGLEHVPSKLSKLCEVNEVLSYQPWLISKDHIEKLARGADNWSMSELMQAIVLLIHFHSLSSFVFGCGVNPEADHPDGHFFESVKANDVAGTSPRRDKDQKSNGHAIVKDQNGGSDGGIKMLMERMMRLMRDETRNNVTKDELLQRFEKFETENAEIMATSSCSLRCTSRPYQSCAEDGGSVCAQELTRHELQMRRSTFRVQDYSWEDHGYSLSNRLYPEIETLLDKKFNVAQNLTYHKMGDNMDVDTSSFRIAIWNYIQCLYGIRHDDYDYDLIDQLLERDLKSYIRMLAFHPENVKKEDYSQFMADLKHSEKVHINLMLFEARLQAELLYSLRAITRYMM